MESVMCLARCQARFFRQPSSTFVLPLSVGAAPTSLCPVELCLAPSRVGIPTLLQTAYHPLGSSSRSSAHPVGLSLVQDYLWNLVAFLFPGQNAAPTLFFNTNVHRFFRSLRPTSLAPTLKGDAIVLNRHLDALVYNHPCQDYMLA